MAAKESAGVEVVSLCTPLGQSPDSEQTAVVPTAYPVFLVQGSGSAWSLPAGVTVLSLILRFFSWDLGMRPDSLTALYLRHCEAHVNQGPVAARRGCGWRQGACCCAEEGG